MIGSVKYQNFLTPDNLAFCQRLAAAENVDIVAAKTYTKDTIICYRNCVNVQITNENLQRINDWVGGVIAYKVLNQGEPVPAKEVNLYRQAKGELLKALEEQQ